MQVISFVQRVNRIMEVSTGKLIVTNLGTSMARSAAPEASNPTVTPWMHHEVSTGLGATSQTLMQSRLDVLTVVVLMSFLLCLGCLCCFGRLGSSVETGYRLGKERGNTEESFHDEAMWQDEGE